jgi:transketolase
MNENPRLPMRRIFGEHLVRMGRMREDIVVLDADVSSSTQTCLFGKAFPDRFINCGIAEANMVSVAAGIAASGLRPVASTFAFLLATRAADQVRSQIAYSRLPVVLAGGYAGLSDFADGGSHQSVADVAALAALPNMTVVCPGDATETELALDAALNHDGPVYVRLSRAEVGRLDLPGPFVLGKAIVRRDGTDVALIATGQMLETTLEAAARLENNGISARVVDMHTVKPIDSEAVIAAADRCGRVVTCEEHSIVGGLGSMVCSVLAHARPTPVRMIGIRDAFGQSGTYAQLREHYGLTAHAVAAAAQELLAVGSSDEELRR